MQAALLVLVVYCCVGEVFPNRRGPIIIIIFFQYQVYSSIFCSPLDIITEKNEDYAKK